MLALVLAPAISFADDGQVINMNQTGGGGHDEGVPPEVIYDGGEETLTVELDMTAPAGYVEVTDDATGATHTAAPLAGGGRYGYGFIREARLVEAWLLAHAAISRGGDTAAGGEDGVKRHDKGFAAHVLAYYIMRVRELLKMAVKMSPTDFKEEFQRFSGEIANDDAFWKGLFDYVTEVRESTFLPTTKAAAGG